MYTEKERELIYLLIFLPNRQHENMISLFWILDSTDVSYEHFPRIENFPFQIKQRDAAAAMIVDLPSDYVKKEERKLRCKFIFKSAFEFEFRLRPF